MGFALSGYVTGRVVQKLKEYFEEGNIIQKGKNDRKNCNESL